MIVALKLAVLKLGQPQYVIAARAGMSETRLSRILQGRVEPTEAEKVSLCSVLGNSDADLFAREDRG